MKSQMLMVLLLYYMWWTIFSPAFKIFFENLCCLAVCDIFRFDLLCVYHIWSSSNFWNLQMNVFHQVWGIFWPFIFFTPYSHLLELPLHLCWDTWCPTGRRGSVPFFDLFSSFGLDTFNLSIHKFTLSLLLNPDRYNVIFITDILLFIFMVVTISSSLLRLPVFEALPLYFSLSLKVFFYSWTYL